MREQTCETCRYWKRYGMGECHRYPQRVDRCSAEWCGEWRETAEAEVQKWQRIERTRAYLQRTTDQYASDYAKWLDGGQVGPPPKVNLEDESA